MASGFGLRFAVVSAVLPVLALALAGCAQGPTAPSSVATSDAAAGSGRWVDGAVVDQELRPVVGARVLEAGTAKEAPTDDQGRFRLDNVSASSGVMLEARHPAFHNATLRVDLQYVVHAEVRFVLTPRPSVEPYHETKISEGEIACQVAFGSHHGFPGFYRRSCAEVLPESRERIQVPVSAGVVAGIVELAWEPQSQFADIMGMTLYVSTKKEEILIAAVHSLAGDHYVSVYTGSAPVQSARPEGGVFDAYVHVDPSALDEHVPTNVGVVVQQGFTLYTTAFYGAAPPPTWSALKAK